MSVQFIQEYPWKLVTMTTIIIIINIITIMMEFRASASIGFS